MGRDIILVEVRMFKIQQVLIDYIATEVVHVFQRDCLDKKVELLVFHNLTVIGHIPCQLTVQVLYLPLGLSCSLMPADILRKSRQ